MTEKIWFVTGASRGFGRIWTEAAAARGDKVAATARDMATLSDLSTKFGANILPLTLDVTDHDAVAVRVNEAHHHFGRLDVVLTNQGRLRRRHSRKRARTSTPTSSGHFPRSRRPCRCYARNGAAIFSPSRVSAGW